MLRFVGYLGAWVVLLLAGAWVGLDMFAADIVRSGLDDLEVQGLLDFEQAGLRMPSLVSLTGAELDDPLTGQTIARVEHIEIEAGIDRRPAHWGLEIRAIRGRGGRVVLAGEIAESAFVRALGDVIDTIVARQTGPGGPLPPMEFRDLEIVLRARDMPLQVFRDCTVWITEHDDLLRVEVRLGPRGGLVLLAFGLTDDNSGLREIVGQDVPVEPPLLAAVNGACEELARIFSPTGRATVTVHVGLDESVAAEGELAQATLRMAQVPFPLENVTLPFTWREEHLLIEDSSVEVAGGMLTTRVEHSPERLEVQAHLLDAELTRDLFRLVPGSRDLEWLEIENGGNVELHLAYTDDRDEAGARVEGWGGLHAERIRLSAAALGSPGLVEVEHVLGRFEIDDGLLQLHDMSGLVASGVVFMDGSFDTPTGAVALDVVVRDVDLAELHAALAPPEHQDKQPVGWLEGRLDFTGVSGTTAANRARGQLSVRAAELFDLPLISTIARLLRPLGKPPRERQRLELKYTLTGLDVVIDELNFESDFLPLYANSGRVSLADQTIDMTIIPARVPIGFVGDVFQLIEGQLIQVRVTGDLGDPSVAVFPLATVTRPITGVFGWISDALGNLLGFGD